MSERRRSFRICFTSLLFIFSFKLFKNNSGSNPSVEKLFLVYQFYDLARSNLLHKMHIFLALLPIDQQPVDVCQPVDYFLVSIDQPLVLLSGAYSFLHWPVSTYLIVRDIFVSARLHVPLFPHYIPANRDLIFQLERVVFRDFCRLELVSTALEGVIVS